MTVEPPSGLSLDDTEYHITQRVFRNKYTAKDSDGNVVLTGKQKLFRLREEFPFQNPQGEDVMRVTAESVFDFAGQYVLEDSQTDQPILILDRKFTLFMRKWELRDPDTGETVATIRTDKTVGGLLRKVSSLFPYHYTIETPDGEEIGEIVGELSLFKDKYRVELTGSTPDAPREAILAAAMVIDALNDNRDNQ